MRIVAGVAKGRRLTAPRGGGTRPFTGKAKEAVFSMLGSAIEGASVLDLFAGSGSLTPGPSGRKGELLRVANPRGNCASQAATRLSSARTATRRHSASPRT
ncbi:MAG: RsmD family RNA methyltransferase, partial [Acidimicrobiia bacterium]